MCVDVVQVLTMRDMGAMALILAGLAVVIFDRYWRGRIGSADDGRGIYEAVGRKGYDEEMELTIISVQPGSGLIPADAGEPLEVAGLTGADEVAAGSTDSRPGASAPSSEAALGHLLAESCPFPGSTTDPLVPHSRGPILTASSYQAGRSEHWGLSVAPSRS